MYRAENAENAERKRDKAGFGVRIFSAPIYSSLLRVLRVLRALMLISVSITHFSE